MGNISISKIRFGVRAGVGDAAYDGVRAKKRAGIQVNGDQPVVRKKDEAATYSPACAVPSALRSLTTVFGMGTGGTFSPGPPHQNPMPLSVVLFGSSRPGASVSGVRLFTSAFCLIHLPFAFCLLLPVCSPQGANTARPGRARALMAT